MLGTVKYLAPEQVRGDPVDGRTDVYALGVVLFECLCARPPFTGDNPAATALARLQHAPPRPSHLRPTIPRRLDQVDPAVPGDRSGGAVPVAPPNCGPRCSNPRCSPIDDDLTVIEAAPAVDRFVDVGRSHGSPRSRHRRGRRRAGDARAVAPAGAGHRAAWSPRSWWPSCCSTTPISAAGCSARPRTATRRGASTSGSTSSTPHVSALASFDPDGSWYAGRERRGAAAGHRRPAHHRLEERVVQRPTLRQPQAGGRPDPHARRGDEGRRAGRHLADPGLGGLRLRVRRPVSRPTTLDGWGNPVDQRRSIAGTPRSTSTATPLATCSSGSPIWATALRSCAPRSTSSPSRAERA